MSSLLNVRVAHLVKHLQNILIKDRPPISTTRVRQVVVCRSPTLFLADTMYIQFPATSQVSIFLVWASTCSVRTWGLCYWNRLNYNLDIKYKINKDVSIKIFVWQIFMKAVLHFQGNEWENDHMEKAIFIFRECLSTPSKKTHYTITPNTAH